MDFNLIVSLTSSSIEIVKTLRQSLNTIKEIDVKMQLADLSNYLADIKMQMAEFKTTLANKDEEIQRLQTLLNLKKSVKWNKFYYSLDKNGTFEGEYCTKCWDQNEKLLRLKNIGRNDWQCLECKNYFEDPNDKTGRPDQY